MLVAHKRKLTESTDMIADMIADVIAGVSSWEKTPPSIY
jgi:hypothetical protein